MYSRTQKKKLHSEQELKSECQCSNNFFSMRTFGVRDGYKRGGHFSVISRQVVYVVYVR